VHEQQQRQRGPKVYSLHAPEVECIGKGKAHPNEMNLEIVLAMTVQPVTTRRLLVANATSNSVKARDFRSPKGTSNT